MKRFAGFVLLGCAVLSAQPVPKLPPLREQARIQQEWLAKRLDTVVPALMRKHNVAMWILTMREYAEDPVFHSIVSPTTLAARRRSIYVFFNRGPEKGEERLSLDGSIHGGLYKPYRESQQ